MARNKILWGLLAAATLATVVLFLVSGPSYFWRPTRTALPDDLNMALTPSLEAIDNYNSGGTLSEIEASTLLCDVVYIVSQSIKEGVNNNILLGDIMHHLDGLPIEREAVMSACAERGISLEESKNGPDYSYVTVVRNFWIGFGLDSASHRVYLPFVRGQL